MSLIDLHDAILHVEIQSILFLPKHQALTVAIVHIGRLKFAPKRNIRVPQQLLKTRWLSHAMRTQSVASVPNNFKELGRANERLFKRIVCAGNARHHKESDGRGRRLIAGPSQFRTLQFLAETILRTAKEGERDPSTLQRMALLELQIAPRN
jgi:hypothetical protein